MLISLADINMLKVTYSNFKENIIHTEGCISIPYTASGNMRSCRQISLQSRVTLNTIYDVFIEALVTHILLNVLLYIYYKRSHGLRGEVLSTLQDIERKRYLCQRHMQAPRRLLWTFLDDISFNHYIYIYVFYLRRKKSRKVILSVVSILNVVSEEIRYQAVS